MTVKTGQAWAGTFVTLDATGALSTGTPSGVLYVDGVADAATVTITGSNPYKWSVTLPSLTAGQRVDMYITATISTIATASVVASEQADTALVSEVKTDTAAILADTGTDGVLVSSGTGAKQINLDAGKVLLQATQTGVTIPTVTAVTNGVGLADDAITAAKFDESTAFPVKSADTGATAIARVGADSDTLETLSDQMDAIKTETAAIVADTGTDGVIVASIANDAITAAALKADAVAEIQNGLATPTNITAGTITTVTSVTNGVTLADDAITAAKFDESTAFPVKSADTGATQIARVGADSDTLETLSDQIDSAALEATLTAIKGAGWADETLVTIQEAAESVSVPSAADVADAVWDEEISGHSTGTTFGGKNQKVVPSETINDYKADVSGLAVSGEYTPTLSALADAINSIDSGAGGGATAKTYTVTASGSGLPIADVDVWVTADAGGNNIVASQRTNSLGQVTFYLDSGITYYIWRQKDGVNFTNPDVEVA